MKQIRKSAFKADTGEFETRLSEAQDFFATKYQTNIVGKDFEEIITNNELFESYVDRLTDGFDAVQEDNLRTLLENTRSEILTESTTSGVLPFNSLSMPVMVKLWARLSMTEAVPTEPTDTPSFTIPFMKPYIEDAEGHKFDLPEGINNTPEKLIDLVKLTPEVSLTGGKVDNYDLFTGITSKVRKGVDHVDRKFYVVGATIEGETVDFKHQRLVAAADGSIFGTVKYIKPSGRDNEPGTEQTEKFIGHLDVENNTLTLVGLSGKTTAIKILGHVSSEAHTTAQQVGYDWTRKDVNIGTAQHIESSLSIEYLQDLKAMYDIDGTAKAADLMSSTSAQKVDLDLIEFIQQAYEGTEAAYTKSFNVFPNSDYAMHPDEWMTGLRRTIDFVTTTMKNDFKCYDARWVIVGNPLDTDLIPNVQWTFRGAENNVAGIDVQYSIGAVKASNYYKIVSSDLIPQGRLYIFGVPTRESYRTLTFFPYTFNITQNYLNAKNPNVPSLMLTRRYTAESFTPIIGAVNIRNNNGTLYDSRTPDKGKQ